MATYIELHDLVGATAMSDVRKRIRVALTVKAQAVAADGTSTAAEREWAKSALASVTQYEEIVLRYLLALNKDVAVGVITGAQDAAVQTAVNGVVDTLLAV
jgi:hypothetical protein